MEHEGDGVTSCNWCTWKYHQRIDKRTKYQWTSNDHSDDIILKIG